MWVFGSDFDRLNQELVAFGKFWVVFYSSKPTRVSHAVTRVSLWFTRVSLWFTRVSQGSKGPKL